MKKAVIIILFILVILGILAAIQAGKIAINGRKLSYTNKPFERIIPNANLHILFLGDSTAVGTGTNPPTSTAGWLAKDFPGAEIKNISYNGLRLAQLHYILNRIPENDHYYDVAILQIGANDIMHFTPLKNITTELLAIIKLTQERADNVVILHCGDLGKAPIFTWPFDWILSKRTYKIRTLYQDIAAQTGAHYVDLISLNMDDTMAKNPETYYAADGLHLSATGYSVWYSAIRQTMRDAGITLKN